MNDGDAVFKPIYKKIAEDFAFLSDYDYRFECNWIHHVHPSVKFKSNKEGLSIGFDREENRMTLYRYIPAEAYSGIDMLKGISLTGKKYKDQVEQVKEILLKVLKEFGS